MDTELLDEDVLVDEIVRNCSNETVESCIFEQSDYAHINRVELWICAVFYFVTVVVGILFNACALFVVLRPNYNRNISVVSKTDLQRLMSGQSDEKLVIRRNCRRMALRETLLFLCTCDIIVILVCIPVRFVRWFTYTWTFGLLLCKMVFYLQYWIGICSTLALMLVTFQRYYAAAHPLKVRAVWTARCRRLSLALIGLVAALLASPVLVSQVHKPVGGSYYWCVTEFSSELVLIIFEIYLYVILIIIPLVSMIVVYTVIVRKISSPRHAMAVAPGDSHSRAPVQSTERKSSPLRSDCTMSAFTVSSMASVTQIATAATLPTSAAKSLKIRRCRNRRVLLMSIVSVAVFALCWMPYQTDRLLSAYGLVPQYNVGSLRQLRMATTLLSHANACLNPLVYCISSSHFRKSAAQIFR